WLFAAGYGLHYPDKQELAVLPTYPGVDACATTAGLSVFHTLAVPPFALYLGDANAAHHPPAVDADMNSQIEWPEGHPVLRLRTVQVNTQQDAKSVTWLGAGRFYAKSAQPRDLMPLAAAHAALQSDVVIDTPATAPVQVYMGCGRDCMRTVELARTFAGYAKGSRHTVSIPLQCFIRKGADLSHIDVPFGVQASPPFSAAFAAARVLRRACAMGERGNPPRWTTVSSFVLLSVLALAALYLPRRTVPAPPPRIVPAMHPFGPAVESWVSTQDRKLRLAQQPDIEITADDGAPADVVVDTGKTYQSIVGFGAALTDSSAWLIQNRMNALQRHDLLQELFGPPPGLNLNMMRLTVGASDFSLQQYTLDDLPFGQVDPDLQHFNTAANLRDLIPTVREALAVNPGLRIVASPWSAPAWMKTSANLIGGTLLEQYESTYAQYLLKYVDTYRSYGIP